MSEPLPEQPAPFYEAALHFDSAQRVDTMRHALGASILGTGMQGFETLAVEGGPSLETNNAAHERYDELMLCLTEFATNAEVLCILASVEVGVTRAAAGVAEEDRDVVIAVKDTLPNFSTESDRADGEHGWGFGIVNLMADECGYISEADGKTLWARFGSADETEEAQQVPADHMPHAA